MTKMEGCHLDPQMLDASIYEVILYSIAYVPNVSDFKLLVILVYDITMTVYGLIKL